MSIQTKGSGYFIGLEKKNSGKIYHVEASKNYSVFMSAEEGRKLYAVTGIIDSLSDMFHSSQLPLFMEAVLLPFESKIIYDSLLMPYSIYIGSNMRRGFNDDYREIKAKHGIITAI